MNFIRHNQLVIQRGLAASLATALSDSPVVFLQGARQVGKSTLVQALPRRRYLTLDDATLLAAANSNPQGFIDGLSGSVTIDEVQRAPELALAIKVSVDRERQSGRATAGRFLLTGSAGVLVLPRLADSLAGRMEILTLWPLSESETTSPRRGHNIVDELFKPKLKIDDSAKIDWPTVIELLARGGYPEIRTRTSEPRRAAWFESYLTTILQRDIRDLARIEGLAQLPRLLSLLASRSASLMNYADLARTLSMQQTTFKNYVALLQGVFLMQLIPAWFTNSAKRFAKSPKILVNDSGLLMHLIGASQERLLADPALAGHVVESWVGMELIKQASWSELKPKLLHFNVHQGDEVDFVLEDRRGRVVGLEVKSSASVDTHAFRGLRALQKLAGPRFVRGIVVYSGHTIVPFDSHMHAVPLAALGSAE
jgi:uncharacterized protein